MAGKWLFARVRLKKPYLYPVKANYPPLLAVDRQYFLEAELTTKIR
ncbi:hypothetical protein GCWU000325_02662 [Alloprevotella tannerae ATCC 51259]|uniref:Uncharacterized protein n=1 Tax=Alloprevotella tannerae ATCC 51259 TaxID=626522 RepID=C9LK97_9BACT|nr:hypothetical protein GCWU000325_02662 [Alloprevotella tannerae ATCC 51259]